MIEHTSKRIVAHDPGMLVQISHPSGLDSVRKGCKQFHISLTYGLASPTWEFSVTVLPFATPQPSVAFTNCTMVSLLVSL